VETGGLSGGGGKCADTRDSQLGWRKPVTAGKPLRGKKKTNSGRVRGSPDEKGTGDKICGSARQQTDNPLRSESVGGKNFWGVWGGGLAVTSHQKMTVGRLIEKKGHISIWGDKKTKSERTTGSNIPS